MPVYDYSEFYNYMNGLGSRPADKPKPAPKKQLEQREDMGFYERLDNQLGGWLPGGIGRDDARPVTLPEPENPFLRGLGIATDKLVSGATLGLSNLSDKIIPDPTPITPRNTTERAIGAASDLLGSTMPVNAAYGLASKLPQLANMGKYGQALTKGALAGAGTEGLRSTIEGNSLPQIGQDALLGAALFGGGDVALKGLGGLFNVARPGALENLSLTKPFPALPGPKPTPELQPGNMGLLTGRIDNTVYGRGNGRTSLPMTGEESINRQYAQQAGVQWPLNTQGKAQVDFLRNMDNLQGPLKETVTPPMPKKNRSLALADYVFEGMNGEIPLTEIRKLKYNDVLEMAQGIAKQRKENLWETVNSVADKRGIDLEDTYKTATDTEYAKWKDVVGLGEPQLGTYPTGSKPQAPTAELNIARRKLKGTIDVNRAAKILETYPELKPEFKGLVSRIERARQPQKKIQSFAGDTEVRPQPMTASQEAKVEPQFTNNIPVNKLKDLGGWRLYMTDIYRNINDVFGEHSGKIKESILNPFDASKKSNVEFQEKLLNELKTEVVDKLGIKRGSKLSGLIQKYGEKQITIDELKRQAPEDWEKVVEADNWFRQKYDELINQVNTVRQQIYPTNPDKQVPRRSDYYRHFREMQQGFAALKNIFDSPAQIDPALSGISEFTQPKAKWASFMQKRGMGPFKNDAVGGFIDYVPAASYSVHIDPHISKFEGLAEELAGATGESRNLNNFIEYLRDYSRDLAGKTNAADRFVQKVIPGGRKTFAALNWLNSRIKANTVLANASSVLAQTANIPNGVAAFKQYSVPGVGRTLKAIFSKDNPIQKSGFIKERYGGYGGKLYRQFDVGMINKARNFAVWAMENADRMGTYFIWNSAYSKALAQGARNPVKFADDAARKLVAGRGIGEVPLLQKSKIFQLVAPFQLEVANLWSVQRDFIKAKDFGALATLYLGAFVFNKAMENIKGSGVMFDPIDAMLDALDEDNTTAFQKGGRLVGEVLSNMPLGQTVASWYPEYGGDLLGQKLPTREKFFGREDPTRFGTGLLAFRGLADPLTKVLPPFGGNQVKKTIEGDRAIKDKAVYTKNGEQLKFPVNTDTTNKAKGLLFGTGGLREAKDFYGEGTKPLSKKQTEAYQKKVDQGKGNKQAYNEVTWRRELDAIDREISKLKNSYGKMPEGERVNQLQKLREKRRTHISKRRG